MKSWNLTCSTGPYKFRYEGISYYIPRGLGCHVRVLQYLELVDVCFVIKTAAYNVAVYLCSKIEKVGLAWLIFLITSAWWIDLWSFSKVSTFIDIWKIIEYHVALCTRAILPQLQLSLQIRGYFRRFPHLWIYVNVIDMSCSVVYISYPSVITAESTFRYSHSINVNVKSASRAL